MTRTQTTILILSALILCGVSGGIGYVTKDYQQCKFELAAFNSPILGTDN